MKIGIEVQRLFRIKKYGIETSALALLKAFQEVNSHFEFVVFVKDDKDAGCLAESSNLKIKKVAGELFVDFEHFFLPLASRREKIDLLHCTGNTTPYFAPVPVVQTLHDIIFMDAIPRKDSFYQRFGNLYRRRVVPVITPRSRAVITVSHYEKERIVSRLGIPENKVEVVYNGIDHQHFKIHPNTRARERVQAIYNLPQEFILFLGNTSGRKNALAVLEAYIIYLQKTAIPLPLVTPGLSAKFILSALRHLNAEFDPQKFITPGYIREEDLPFVYSLSSVFLFPSLSEGFGMPIVEAMACGTPVVTSKISCMPEIAGGAAVLVDPLSPPSIADALLAILLQPELRTEKIRDGLTNASRFSWKKSAEHVLHIYENILEPHQKKVKPAGKKLILEPNLFFFNRLRS